MNTLEPDRQQRCLCLGWCLVILMGLTGCQPAAEPFGETVFGHPDFRDVSSLQLFQSARQQDDVIQLTAAARSENGLVFHAEPVPLADGFETRFTFRLSRGGGVPDATDGSGGDGLAFVILGAAPDPVPELIGYIPYHFPGALAVEFDTWLNSNLGDPDGNHVSVQAGPAELDPHTPFTAFEHGQSLGWAAAPVNLAAGNVHAVRITYQPGRLQVFLNEARQPLVTVAVELTTVTDAQGRGYVGLVAGTGAAYQSHEILSWSFHGQPVQRLRPVASPP